MTKIVVTENFTDRLLILPLRGNQFVFHGRAVFLALSIYALDMSEKYYISCASMSYNIILKIVQLSLVLISVILCIICVQLFSCSNAAM